MTFGKYIKKMGLIKICELCNWDLRDIRLHLIRIVHIRDARLTTVMKQFRDLFKEKTEVYKKDPKLIEIIKKLKGEEYDD